MAKMKNVIYFHGINETNPLASDVKEDWDSMIFGSNYLTSHLLYWGDLSVVQQFALPNIIDELLAELFKMATANKLLQDVNHYFTKPDMRAEIHKRFYKISEKLDPTLETVVIAHSMGTVLAYDCIMESGIKVDEFITLGSPLGFLTLQAELKRVMDLKDLPYPKSVKNWNNFSDMLDIVATHKMLSPFYHPSNTLHDHIVVNPDAPTYPHSLSGYMRIPHIKRTLKSILM